jgi:hypothetical protein
MNPVQSLLQDLPRGVRKTVYAILILVGAVLTALQGAGVEDLGPITLNDALKAYAVLSPLIGVLAVANVSKPREQEFADSGSLGDVAGTLDLSSFEPVGQIDDVYEQNLT